MSRQSELHKIKHRARSYATLAQKNGKLVPKPCESCGAVDVEKHHEDYSKPLEVTWLCHDCHRLRHRGKVVLPKLTKDIHPRDRELLRRYRNGATLAALGRYFGLSVPGIASVLSRHGVKRVAGEWAREAGE